MLLLLYGIQIIIFFFKPISLTMKMILSSALKMIALFSVASDTHCFVTFVQIF